MVRRTPHEPGAGEYVQERLQGVLESAPLAEQFKHSPLKVYLQIPPRGSARLVGEHPAWSERVLIVLSELHMPASVVRVSSPPRALPTVRSTRVVDSQQEARGTGEPNR
jgi:hypothetical protein